MYGSFALMTSSDNRLFALKISKTGEFEKCISIDKPNVSYFPAIAVNYGAGNSTFLNGKHYFCATESAIAPFDKDINQIILDEELNMIEDCSELDELTLTETDIPVTVLQMGITNSVLPLSLSDGITIEDQLMVEPCSNLSLDLAENSGCSQSVISANVAGFTQPTFYWSDGTVSTVNTLSVTSTDTVFVRAMRGEFDAVIAPYHDVGMTAIKVASFGEGVNITLGLPIIRTSVDHGTALDLAGSGKVDTGSLQVALQTAYQMAVHG